MENIIQQIALDLVEKITKKAFEAKISDIDTLASDVLADCKTAACEILEAAVAQLNESIRKEKATRKELDVYKRQGKWRRQKSRSGKASRKQERHYEAVSHQRSESQSFGIAGACALRNGKLHTTYRKNSGALRGEADRSDLLSV